VVVRVAQRARPTRLQGLAIGFAAENRLHDNGEAMKVNGAGIRVK
jgi:hypothetical protein